MNRAYAFSQLVLARMREFFREPIAIFWVYGFPLILAFILGLAFSRANVEPPTVDLVIVQAGKLDLAAALKDNKVDVHGNDRDEAMKRLRQARTALVIVADLDALEYIHDPTRPESTYAKYWVDSILARAQSNLIPLAKDVPVVAPGSRYIDFLLPGLVGINLMGGGLFGFGFVIVEMRVRKLFKRLMATPMHRGDFLLAMIAARLLFLIPEMATLLIVARWLFGVPILGSLFALIVVVFAGAMTFAGIGLLLGCRTEKTETISGLVNLVMLPQYLVSGVFFSSKKFPEMVQPLIQALPLTQLIDALREVMLVEGAGLADISGNLLILAIWGFASFALALRWFKWT